MKSEVIFSFIQNNKNKKKKKKAKKDSVAGMTTTASFDADDSSSLHSGGNVDADVEKECLRTEIGNGKVYPACSFNIQVYHYSSGNISVISLLCKNIL